MTFKNNLRNAILVRLMIARGTSIENFKDHSKFMNSHQKVELNLGQTITQQGIPIPHHLL
jgi:hypothetical protein